MSTTADRTKADRQRRWRARQHPSRRERIIPEPVSDVLVDFLVATRWLRESDRDDRRQIAAALVALHEDMVKNFRNASTYRPPEL